MKTLNNNNDLNKITQAYGKISADVDGNIQKQIHQMALVIDCLISKNRIQTDLIKDPTFSTGGENFAHKIETEFARGYFGEKNFALWENKDLERGSALSKLRTKLTRQTSKYMGNIRRALAFRLGEETIKKSNDFKIEKAKPKTKGDVEQVTTPKTDVEKIHAQINNAIVIAQNSKDENFNKVELLILLQKITIILK